MDRPKLPPPPPQTPPLPCDPCTVTAGVAASIGNVATSTQLSFPSRAVTSECKYNGTLFTEPSIGGLFVPQKSTEAELYAYVQNYRWLKGGAYVSQVQTSTLRKRPAVLDATLRTPRVWVDRPTLYTVYNLRDEDGSFFIDRSQGFMSVLIIDNDTSTCSSSQQNRHLDYCSWSVPSARFAGLNVETTVAVDMRVTPGDGSANLETSLGNVRLTPPPKWWDADLRAATTGTRGSAPANVTAPCFVTLPTYPVYATAAGVSDTFEAIVFANQDEHPVDSWTIQVSYDAAKLTYVSFSASSDYAAPTYSHTPGSLTFLTTAPSAAGGEAPARRKGVFFMIALSFQVRGNIRADSHAGLIDVLLLSFVNSANNAFLKAKMAQVLDHREITDSTSGSMQVVAINEVALMPYAADYGGQLLHSHTLYGTTTSRDYGGSLITDCQLSSTSSAYRSTNLQACSKSSAETAFDVSAIGGSCRLEPQPDLSATTLVNFTASVDNLSYSVTARILVPSGVEISVADTTLNRIRGVECKESGEYAYQRTAVRVYGNGLDVTSLATNVSSSNSTVADFVTPMTVLRGKSAGTATLKLFLGSSVESPEITVSDAETVATALRNRVITDVSWVEAPPASYTYPSKFSSSLLLRQVQLPLPAPASSPTFTLYPTRRRSLRSAPLARHKLTTASYSRRSSGRTASRRRCRGVSARFTRTLQSRI